jgi:multidrug efflux pump
MLTGTLITAAGFLPIATAASSTGEYTRSIFQVVTISLLLSWIAAVVFVPYLGDKLLPDFHSRNGNGKHDHDPYDNRFYQRFRTLLEWCVRHRKTVIAATVALFVVAVMLFRFVPQQFFPSSTRVELMVDLKLAEGSSLKATEAQARKLEALLQKKDGVENYVAYVGTGSPRFYLPLDQQLPQASFAQFVLMTTDVEAREEVRRWLIDTFASEFPELQARVTRLENGPPVGYPVQFRVSGEHIAEVRRIARDVAEKVRANPHVANTNLDWEEPSKVVRLVLDQERARALGVSSAHLSKFLESSLSGSYVSTYREDNELIQILLRGPQEERARLVDEMLTRAPGADRRGAVPAGVQQALRLRGHAGHHRAVRHDHAQLGDPGGPDRAGHRKGPERLWEAIVESAVRRFRPIALTAAAPCWP